MPAPARRRPPAPTPRVGRAGQAVSEQEHETRIDAEVRAAREEYAEEEAEVAEAEIAEQARRSTCR